VTGSPFLGLAHVNRQRAVGELLARSAGIDLLDLALDLTENLGSGRAHREKLLNTIGIQYFREYSDGRRAVAGVARPTLPAASDRLQGFAR
jgi:hypothetical protein